MTLIQELSALQDLHGYLREDDLRSLSTRLRVPLSEVQGVISYYPHFRRTPPPRVTVAVCRDAGCHLRGGGRVLETLQALCAARRDVELTAVSCLGRCDTAPVCTVNAVPVPADEVPRYLDEPATLPESPPATRRRAFECDAGEPYAMLREEIARGNADALIDRMKDSGLRGMGGAGFPTGRKWEVVRAQPTEPKHVVCNADESEPGSFKDRVLLEEIPHRVIEGLVLGAYAVGAHAGTVYIRHEYARERETLRSAIRDAHARGVLGPHVCGSDFRFELEIFVSPGGYVLGEETALLEALEGRRGEPRNKPPYPGLRGLFDRPTLVQNVETLALVPYVLRTGRADRKLFSVSGDVESPGVHEMPVGTTLRDLLARCGGVRAGRKLLAFLPGGASTGFLTADQADVVLDWDPLRAAGSALGSGAVLVVAEGTDLMDLAVNLTAFFRNESCGKCVPCRIGTEKAVRILERKRPADLALLPELHETLQQTSICGLGQAALNPVVSLLERFPSLG
ncbi:MAG: NAD(P)H-dependent oxidoreductase subunit E [Myxococcota bacterium]